MKRNALFLIIFLLVLGSAFYWISNTGGKNFEFSKQENQARVSPLAQSLEVVSNSETNLPRSPISGLACENAKQRPLSVMLSSDSAARPLSAISEADLVVEMPVITDSITRLMAVFVCGRPKEIGSVRSARHDFIPLARGWDAILVHWGGSHFALEKLNAGAMDHLDALPNPYGAFYRQPAIPAPHNGFTSWERLTEAVRRLGYRQAGKLSGYPHLETKDRESPTDLIVKTLTIGYPDIFRVEYQYQPASDVYLRSRGGKKEMDKNNGQPVAAKNVVIMRARSRQIEGQYNDVQIEGSGQAAIYRHGQEIIGTWQKEAANPTSKLSFYNSQGEEIKFAPGQIWIEVVELGQSVTWK